MIEQEEVASGKTRRSWLVMNRLRFLCRCVISHLDRLADGLYQDIPRKRRPEAQWMKLVLIAAGLPIVTMAIACGGNGTDNGVISPAEATATSVALSHEAALGFLTDGQTYRDQGDLQSAIDNYNKALEQNPKLAPAFSGRAVAEAELGDHAKAIADYSRAIELEPKVKDAYNGRGASFYRRRQYQNAIDDFTKAIDIDSGWPEPLNGRALAYRELGEYDRALADLDRAIGLEPKQAFYFNRGCVFIKLRDWRAAVADSNRALESDLQYLSANSAFGGDGVRATVASVGFLSATVSAEAQATGARSVFPGATREIRAIVVINGAKAGTKVTGRWYQICPANAGPEGLLINSAEVVLGAADVQANGRATPNFTQRNQTGPLPEDNWILRVYINDEYAATAGFIITHAFTVAPP